MRLLARVEERRDLGPPVGPPLLGERLVYPLLPRLLLRVVVVWVRVVLRHVHRSPVQLVLHRGRRPLSLVLLRVLLLVLGVVAQFREVGVVLHHFHRRLVPVPSLRVPPVVRLVVLRGRGCPRRLRRRRGQRVESVRLVVRRRR